MQAANRGVQKVKTSKLGHRESKGRAGLWIKDPVWGSVRFKGEPNRFGRVYKGVRPFFLSFPFSHSLSSHNSLSNSLTGLSSSPTEMHVFQNPARRRRKPNLPFLYIFFYSFFLLSLLLSIQTPKIPKLDPKALDLQKMN